MAYHSETSPTSRFLGFGLVIAFHIFVIYALATGLATTMVEVIKGPLQVDTLVEKQDEKKAPPPPPPQTLKPPPVYVPPPEINIQTTTTTNNAIQAVSSAHTNPRATAMEPVDYPNDAAHVKAEGDALFSVDVDDHGRVTDVRFVRLENLVNTTPEIEAEFQAKALAYIKNKMRFKPATNAGVAAAATNVPVRVKFRCKDPALQGERNC